MAYDEKIFKLTAEDKAKYEKQINEIDLSIKEETLANIPEKLKNMINLPNLTNIQISLIEDISRLYTLIKTIPELEESIQRRIVFALCYFNEPDDEIPDYVPIFGYLDDAAVVRWVVDRVTKECRKYLDK